MNGNGKSNSNSGNGKKYKPVSTTRKEADFWTSTKGSMTIVKRPSSGKKSGK